MGEMDMLLVKECNLRVNGWDLDLIISSLDQRVENDIDTFEDTIKYIEKLSKQLKKRQKEINKSYMEYKHA